MEVINQRVKFYGDGAKYFGILIVNFLLTVITLGLYYPWAKAKDLQYLYGETEFAGSRLTFHGTGQEMFKGFIKAILIIGALYGVYFVAQLTGNTLLLAMGFFIYLVGLMLLLPAAIHGSLRYRMSRTSWRGIHFGYRGKLGELAKVFWLGLLLTIVTLGIYSSWLTTNLRRYTVGHIRLGNLRFSFEGKGTDFFLLQLKGIILIIFTLGIYSFWFFRDLQRFFINNLRIYQGDVELSARTNITGGQIFKLVIVTYFGTIFTLGLAIPWLMIMNMRTVLSNIELDGAFNPDAVEQTEEDYNDATGEDMLDMLDIGFDF